MSFFRTIVSKTIIIIRVMVTGALRAMVKETKKRKF